VKPYRAFCDAIRLRESSDNYSCINSLGYLGGYQFGMARLCDLGLTRRKANSGRGYSNGLFEFIDPNGRGAFLGNRQLQDDTFDRHVQALKRLILMRLPDSVDNMSGEIATCHLLGFGGLDKFIRHKIDLVDAFGTKASEYYLLFKDYEIP